MPMPTTKGSVAALRKDDVRVSRRSRTLIPVPGMLAVPWTPRFETFTVAPRHPTDTLVPVLLMFSLTPGRMRSER